MSALGAYIKEQMAARGWSQTDLEARSGVSDATISRIINKGRRPEPANVIKLALAFEDAPEKLMILAGYPMGDPVAPEAVEQELLTQMRALPWLSDLAREIAALPVDQQKMVVRVVRAMLETGEQSDPEP
jgi:transcriptional regulator with XRE-family HTH domain